MYFAVVFCEAIYCVCMCDMLVAVTSSTVFSGDERVGRVILQCAACVCIMHACGCVYAGVCKCQYINKIVDQMYFVVGSSFSVLIPLCMYHCRLGSSRY